MSGEKKNTGNIIIIILLALCIGFCAFLGVVVLGNCQQEQKAGNETSTQYVLYIGTNDKDTYKQEIPIEEAISIVDNICLSHLDGYTLAQAEGRWFDESHTVTVEQTIVCYIDGADAGTVYQICDEVIAALNQNTVLVETNEVTMDYYSGK
ncbi:MAG: hypothetical protein CW338_00510 [Clostridiales bacterium]|nr:hypothetical protein [Clostridiales bacterium]